MFTKLKNQWQYHLMLVPGIIVILIFSYIPLYGLIMAFQKYNPALGFSSPMVGLANFEYIFNQPNFVRTIWNTFYMSIAKLVLGIVVPVTVAIMLNELKNKRVKKIYQTLVYLPNFLSWVILAGVMIDICSADGLINQCLLAVGVGPINFLGNAKIFPWTMIISDVWKGFGFGTVVYLAALTGIDPELYEAAMIDGATRFQQIKRITIPQLLPTVILMTVLALGNVLNNGFDQIYNMYSPAVYESGDIIDTYVFRLGIEQAQYSVGAAVGLFKSVVSAVLVCSSYYLADKFAGYRVF
ncbi:MAG: ABC transporter permease subunit [Eubacteriales bacterium]